MTTFVAIDFETADYQSDSACAIGAVRVEAGIVTARECRLIRPPRSRFQFTYIHGITWEDVAESPGFLSVWDSLAPLFAGADFLAAHNAGFDRSVLRACCLAAGIEPPPLPFTCTVQLARRVWNIRPTKLPNVCDYLGLPLKHHDAASDAEACAQIVIRAGLEAGWEAVHPATLATRAPARTRTGAARYFN